MSSFSTPDTTRFFASQAANNLRKHTGSVKYICIVASYPDFENIDEVR
jgi:hypothetical protein